jgi:hypothetical protein
MMNRISDNAVKLCPSVNHVIFSRNKLPLYKTGQYHPAEDRIDKVSEMR